jgi:hypothetical protein
MTATNTVPTVKKWDTHPDRESLRVIHRFLRQREEIEHVSLEPRGTHPRQVRATVDDQDSTAVPGMLDIGWFETGDFVITYRTNQASSASPLLQWTRLPDRNGVKLSQGGSDDVQLLELSSYDPGENWFHPLQVLPLVLANIEESI